MYPNGLLPEMMLKMKQEENERLLYEIRIQGLVKRKPRKSIFVRILRFFEGVKNVPTAARSENSPTRYEFVDCMQALTPCS